jgi:hypothetical protein
MDADSPTTAQRAFEGDGSYYRRAQALLATRSELFTAAPARVVKLTAAITPRRDGRRSLDRSEGRQLSLPLPRERARAGERGWCADALS